MRSEASASRRWGRLGADETQDGGRENISQSAFHHPQLRQAVGALGAQGDVRAQRCLQVCCCPGGPHVEVREVRDKGLATR